MTYLILVRHGESIWNKQNKFTGWVDVPLSSNGIKEAIRSAKALGGLRIDVAFTSKLQRAQETLSIILANQKKVGIFLHEEKKEKKWSFHPRLLEKDEIPIYSDKALNERYYGSLQGKNKDEVRKKFGEKQVFIWRRSYAIRPPMGESLRDVYKRVLPYFKKNIISELDKGKNVVISAHGNSLRAIIKYIENISDEEIPYVELPTGKPIIYTYKERKLKRSKKFDN